MALAVAGSFLIAVAGARAADNPREHLLLDQHWRFHLGDEADVGHTLDYPEASDLMKVRTADLGEPGEVGSEAGGCSGDAILGEQLQFVRGDFDASGWRELNLPHDWVVELPFSETANYQRYGVQGHC